MWKINILHDTIKNKSGEGLRCRPHILGLSGKVMKSYEKFCAFQIGVPAMGAPITQDKNKEVSAWLGQRTNFVYKRELIFAIGQYPPINRQYWGCDRNGASSGGCRTGIPFRCCSSLFLSGIELREWDFGGSAVNQMRTECEPSSAAESGSFRVRAPCKLVKTFQFSTCRCSRERPEGLPTSAEQY